jgi:HK97 family phage prohead protease
MKRLIKTAELNSTNGSISGYASTFIREPDDYGDIVAKGAFKECIEKLKEEGRVLPFLFNHDSYNLMAYIGTVTDLGEDDHGLKFEATFDDTPEGQKARKLALSGRVCKFSFAYDVLEEGKITLEDGREANELRKLNIHEVSLVMYPANPDTGIIDVKSGRRNSKADEDSLKEAIDHLSAATTIINSLLAGEDKPDDDSKAKSKEQDPANDEEQKELKDLIKKADEMLSKGEK